MAGVSIEIEVKDEAVKKLLAGMQRRMDDITPAMKIIGEILRTSVVRTFEQEGRPIKWVPLAAATVKQRKGSAHPILRRQGFAGGLLGSINAQADTHMVRVGTNKIYAAVQQFGIGAYSNLQSRRPHPRIPARPFLVVQDEDWGEIREALEEYITGGAA